MSSLLQIRHMGDQDLENYAPLSATEKQALSLLAAMYLATGLRVETHGEEILLGRRPMCFAHALALAHVGESRSLKTAVWEDHVGRRWSV